MRKIYIAGKVTGLDPVECAAKFEAAEILVRAEGYKVVNPMKLGINPKASWAAAMKICLLELKLCDAIFMLPCSIDSKGAQRELETAFDFNLDIYTEINDL